MTPLRDHLPVTWQHCIQQAGSDRSTTLRRVCSLGPPPSMTTATWQHMLDIVWHTHFKYNVQDTTTTTWTQPYIDLIEKGDIDIAWHKLQRDIEQALVEATTQAYQRLGLPHHTRNIQPHGAFSCMTTTTTTRRPHSSLTNKDNKLWNSIARLREALRHTAKDIHQSPHLQRLRRKLSHITTNYDHNNLRDLLMDHKRQLQSLQHCQSRRRIANRLPMVSQSVTSTH